MNLARWACWLLLAIFVASPLTLFVSMDAHAAPSSVLNKKSQYRYDQRKDVLMFLKAVSAKHHIPYAWMKKQIRFARYSPLSEKLTTPQPKAIKATTLDKNYRLYRRLLLSENRLQKGLRFIKRNQKTFNQVARRTGVDPFVIAAIIGIESTYGETLGQFRVIDALMTLSFDYERRAKFYRYELERYLLFCWKEKQAITHTRGSFAGAIGLGQFMPSSMERFARDGDGDKKIDIVHNEADAIASVGNYLQKNGWKRGIKPIYRALATQHIYQKAKTSGIQPKVTLSSLFAKGVNPTHVMDLHPLEKVKIVDLYWVNPQTGKNGTHYFLGTASFGAILHYNRSYFYAVAVSEFADSLRAKKILPLSEQ